VDRRKIFKENFYAPKLPYNWVQNPLLESVETPRGNKREGAILDV
jgi:hypothetical protein